MAADAGPPIPSRFRPWLPGVAASAFAGLALAAGYATGNRPPQLVGWGAVALGTAGLFFAVEAFRNVSRLWPWRVWWVAALVTWGAASFCALTRFRP